MLVGCGAVLAALLVGCSGDDSNQTAPTTTVETTSPAPAPTVPATTTVPANPPAAPPAGSDECKAADLDVTLGASEGTAGTTYRALVFTNSGGRTCTIQGFPGVSFVAGEDGHQVGQPAVRVGEKGPVITIKPGAAATSPVGFVSIGNYDPAQCVPTPVRGLRVYPPHDTAAEFVPFETTACAGNTSTNPLNVRTVHAGSGLT